jgi:hypothetical protein
MKPLPRRGVCLSIAVALVAALLAGCAQPPKSGPAKPSASAANSHAGPQPATPANPLASPAKPSVSAADRDAEPQPATPTGATADATKKAGCCAGDAKQTAAASKAGGAKGETVDLTPPPGDQPQPKLVCKQTKIVNEPVWQGKEGVFKFAISNEGEAPLAIRVKPT